EAGGAEGGAADAEDRASLLADGQHHLGDDHGEEQPGQVRGPAGELILTQHQAAEGGRRRAGDQGSRLTHARPGVAGAGLAPRRLDNTALASGDMAQTAPRPGGPDTDWTAQAADHIE